MKRKSLFGAFSILGLLVAATAPAIGGEKWCEEDPVLTIDGRTVDYTASFPSAYVDGTTINWVFHIPVNVLVATAVTTPAVGSPTVPSTVTIVRDQPAYVILSDASVVTTVVYASSASFPTSTAIEGLNSSWNTYSGKSNKKQTISTSYSTMPLLY